MKKNFPILTLIGICLLFFYKTIFFGKIPFPGDLLVSHYSPWRHQSYGGYVAGAVPSKDQYFDVIRELYPWKTVVVNQLKSGKFPLWNPYNFSGSPLLANYQSQVFYPLSLLYYVMPQINAWTILIIIQPILGSIFLYLFATEIGLSMGAAMLTSLLFNFSSFATVWMEFTTVWNTILWLPLLLFLVERGIKQKKMYIGQQLLFVFGLFCAITGGHPQDFINSLLILVIYTLARTVTAKNWTWREKIFFFINPLSFVFAIPFFIAAPQLFPTIELFHNSARVSHEYQQIIEKMLVQWWQLPMVTVQDLFGNPATRSSITGDYVIKTLSIGIVGFFFCLTAIFNRIKSWNAKFFAFAALITLVLTVRSPISEFIYRYPLPVMSTGTPTRILFLLALSMSILAGFGYDAVRENKKIPALSLFMSWLFFIALWIGIFVHPQLPDVVYDAAAITTMKHAMIIATAVLAALTGIIAASRYKKLIFLAIIPLCALELFYSFTKFNPFVPPLFVYPENAVMTYLKTHTGINRFWGYGTAEIEANFATQEQIYSPDGTDPLNLRWYNQLLQSSQNGDIAQTFNRTTRSDALIQPGYGESDLPSNIYRLRLMDVLGVKYVLNRLENPKDQNTFPTDRFKEVWNHDDWAIYENLKAAPRFFITSDVEPYYDVSGFENQFFADEFQPNQTVLLESGDFNSMPQLTKGKSSADLISYEPTNIVISVNSETRQFLFLSDTYDYGWNATVNGKLAKIYKANFAFRGIVIPQGQSTVIFSYYPQSFETGITISIIAILLTGVYVIVLSRTETKPPKTKRTKR